MCSDAKALVAHNHSFDRLIMKGRIIGSAFLTASGTGTCLHQRDVHRYLSHFQGERQGHQVADVDRGSHVLFGVPFEGAHGAMVDTMACMRVFFEMKKRQTTEPV